MIEPGVAVVAFLVHSFSGFVKVLDQLPSLDYRRYRRQIHARRGEVEQNPVGSTPLNLRNEHLHIIIPSSQRLHNRDGPVSAIFQHEMVQQISLGSRSCT